MKRFKSADDIRVGVIGYGGRFQMGRIHLQDMQKVGMVPTAVADLDPAQRKAAAADWPRAEIYDDAGTMLRRSDVNLVVIITPHNTHARLALQCLRAGCHVVLEKPFAITLAECDRMIAEARKRKLLLTTYHNRHWDGCVVQALKTIRSGAIGDLIRVRIYSGGMGQPTAAWRWSKSISGGILYDWGVHYLEYALQIIDAEIAEVMGFATSGILSKQSPWKDDTNEDEATAVVRFRNGVRLQLTMTRIDPTPRPGAKTFEILGTKGVYRFAHTEWELVRPRRGGKTVIETGQNPPDRWDLYYKNVADHLVNGAPLIITPEWARRPIQVLDLADQSARQGKALKAKYA